MLDGKVILITGAARGMGQGIAQAAAEFGARVVATDLEIADLKETASLLEEKGRPALCLRVDVTDEETIEEAVQAVVAEFGRLDGWVNNAGVVKIASALDSTPEERAFQFKVNVEGVYSGCRQAAKQMIAQGGGGSIVNISSEAGKIGHLSMSAYNATKAAVISLTRTFAAEWAEYGINVNAVCPGGVLTPMLHEVARWMTDREGGDPEEKVKTLHPPQLGRNIQPLEVGRVVAFLLSDYAVIIRGQAINADGGATPY